MDLKFLGARGPRLVRDPVCGEQMKFEAAKYKTEHMGRSYFFCSPGCKSSFKKQVSAMTHALTLESKFHEKSANLKSGRGCH